MPAKLAKLKEVFSSIAEVGSSRPLALVAGVTEYLAEESNAEDEWQEQSETSDSSDGAGNS